MRLTLPYIEKLVLVLRDGRKLIGVLRSWDQFGMRSVVSFAFLFEVEEPNAAGISQRTLFFKIRLKGYTPETFTPIFLGVSSWFGERTFCYLEKLYGFQVRGIVPLSSASNPFFINHTLRTRF